MNTLWDTSYEVAGLARPSCQSIQPVDKFVIKTIGFVGKYFPDEAHSIRQMSIFMEISCKGVSVSRRLWHRPVYAFPPV